MENNKLTFTDQNGKEVQATIMFTTHSDEFNADYVVFSIDGTTEVSACKYVELDAEGGELIHIDTDEEWAFLQDLFEQFIDEKESGCHSCCDGVCECGGDCNEECGCKKGSDR